MEILMIRPYQFYFNTETASNNFFQSNHTIENANELAIAEFDNMVKLLRAQKIKVVVIQDTQDPATPDSIFPNNWLSTHPNGTVCLYPMFAKNRRAERKSSVLDFLNNSVRSSSASLVLCPNLTPSKRDKLLEASAVVNT